MHETFARFRCCSCQSVLRVVLHSSNDFAKVCEKLDQARYWDTRGSEEFSDVDTNFMLVACTKMTILQMFSVYAYYNVSFRLILGNSLK